MKLDSRIIEGKRPLCCIDTEEARQFIGKKGYFAEDISMYNKLDYFKTRTLLSDIADNKTNCFKNDVIDSRYPYFLPEEWVKEKEPEPVWQPYDLDTLKEDKIHFGGTIVFRQKTEDGSASVITAIYNGKREYCNDLDASEIMLGGVWFGFQQLFDNYEIYDSVYSNSPICEWRPFGYQE